MRKQLNLKLGDKVRATATMFGGKIRKGEIFTVAKITTGNPTRYKLNYLDGTLCLWGDFWEDITHLYDTVPTNSTQAVTPKAPTLECRCNIKDLLSTGHVNGCSFKRG